MLRQTFTSQPFTYRLPGDMNPAPGAIDTYYPALITPPRIYGEEYDGSGVIAMFVNQEITVDGYEVIYLLLQHNQIFWPSYLYRLHRFDATTGTYLGGVDTVTSPTQHLFSQSRNGTLYSMNEFGVVQQYTIDPTTHDLVTDGVTQFTLTDSTYAGFTGAMAYLIDTELNLLLGNGDLGNYLGVWNLTTGALQARIPTPGYPVVVMSEDTSRCYVMTSQGIIVLIDYSTNRVMSAFRVQTTFQSGVGTQQRSVCWDQKYRRFLSWVYTPVDTTGQNTSVISGYYPTPQAAYLSAPVPIKAPRKYRTTPVLARLCGDMGESVGGGQVVLTLSPGTTIATVGGYPGLTDGDGEALGSINDLDSGSVTLNATATVP